MRVERLYLKEHFPELGKNDCNAYVDCYIVDEMKEMQLDYKLHPCMVICPGGGYGMVSAREAEPIALNFLSEGYCVFIVHYSVHPHQFPQQLLEVAGAVELIHQNAEEWVCDKDNIAIMGFSAGGHLAAQYSNRYNCPEIREVFPESKPVQRSVLCYPVITWEKKYPHAGTMKNFVGHEPVDGTEKGCSCELLVTENTPPAFIWHTTEDKTVPVENSLRYAHALSEHKVPFELHIYPFGWHGLATVDEHTCVGMNEKVEHCHQWIEDCKKWLKLTK